jgi:hypothetical protein
MFQLAVTVPFPEILLVKRLHVLTHHILIPQHFPTVGAGIRAHDTIVREHVLLPRVPMGESLRTDLAHVILGRAKVKALLVAFERLDRGEDVLAVRAGVTQTLVPGASTLKYIGK